MAIFVGRKENSSFGAACSLLAGFVHSGSTKDISRKKSVSIQQYLYRPDDTPFVWAIFGDPPARVKEVKGY